MVGCICLRVTRDVRVAFRVRSGTTIQVTTNTVFEYAVVVVAVHVAVLLICTALQMTSRNLSRTVSGVPYHKERGASLEKRGVSSWILQPSGRLLAYRATAEQNPL